MYDFTDFSALLLSFDRVHSIFLINLCLYFHIQAQHVHTFDENTQFVFSLDGQQFANQPIPEPSVWGILGLALSGSLFLRRRG